MRDARENVLYVGKARNLRKRLNSYRVANPDRMSKRVLRLLRSVERIEWKLCRSEDAALAKEAMLLRSVRPKFNRAGVWPVKPGSIHWRVEEGAVWLRAGHEAEPGWNKLGPLKGARWMKNALARMIWISAHADRGLHGMPAGWLRGGVDEARIECNGASEIESLLHALALSGSESLVQWIRGRVEGKLAPFELAWVEAELEYLAEFTPERISQVPVTAQTSDEQRMFSFA